MIRRGVPASTLNDIVREMDVSKDSLYITLRFPASTMDRKIRLNEVMRKNIGVKIGDIITIHPFSDLKFGKRIHVLPFEDSILNCTKNLFDDFLKPYFLDSYRPIK